MPFLNFTSGLGTSNSIFYNVSYTIANQPPMMTTQTVWITFTLVGIFLLLLSAFTKSDMCNDLAGILACPFLLISAIQSFAVDVITGNTFVGGTDAPYLGVAMQTHTIYHYDLIGVALGIIFIISLANLYRLWLDHKRFTAPDDSQRMDSNVKNPSRGNRQPRNTDDEDEEKDYRHGGR